MEELRRRLRELGVVRGARELASLPPRRRVAIEDLIPGRLYTAACGQCFIVEQTYPLDHRHGRLPLAAFLNLSPQLITRLTQNHALANVNLSKSAFLDTETTGLSGGAGVMAFVVGVGFFTAEGFIVRQHFLRDPGDEPAMIEALAEALPQFEALVSFNGYAFDVPLIESRFLLARRTPPTVGMPHLDLLILARRLWQYGLPSRALSALERDVLGVQREQEDVPSSLIPALYRDYLSTGDAREMRRVLYHNAMDILSLVTLAARMGQSFDIESQAERNCLRGAELYSLGRWHASEGRPGETERAYRAALSATLTPFLRKKALRELAHLLKRSGRPDEAFAFWQQLALEDTDDILAHVELAKYFEWRSRNLPLAAGWTRAALSCVERWPESARRSAALASLRHRLERLERKNRP